MDPFSFPEAAAFQPNLSGEEFVQAYAACGGYPLHLRRWAPDLDVAGNLSEVAFTPGGVLRRNAIDILSEDLDWRGGYERVLAVVSSGARRRSRIVGRAHQRIGHALDRLRRAGCVRQVHSIGAHAASDPLYEIADDCLTFWFSALRDDADLVEGGQGEAVRRRTEGRWQTHLDRALESAARLHVQHVVSDGEVPLDTIVGRWWQDEVAVCAVAPDGDPVLVGECKWRSKPISTRELFDLRHKATMVGRHTSTPQLAFWSQGTRSSPDRVRNFTCDDLLPRDR